MSYLLINCKQKKKKALFKQLITSMGDSVLSVFFLVKGSNRIYSTERRIIQTKSN